IILYHQIPALLYVIDQAMIYPGQFYVYIVCPNSGDYGIKGRKIDAADISHGEHRNVITHCTERYGHIISGTRKISNLFGSGSKIETYGMYLTRLNHLLRWNMIVRNDFQTFIKTSGVGFSSNFYQPVFGIISRMQTKTEYFFLIFSAMVERYFFGMTFPA